MKFDFYPLKAKMLQKNVTAVSLAWSINMKYSTLKAKLENESQFKQEEIVLVCDVLGIPLEQSGKYFSVLAKETN